MQTNRNEVTASTQRDRRPTRVLAQVGVAGLAGTLALAGVGATVASASAGHAKAPSATAKALTAVEKQLSALEKLAPSGATVSETGSTLFYPLFQEW